ncbi:SDR family NAD(P)-dependent oxidoreductase [Modestobacter versicolor]|uniref:3-oxoacyl-ACP reductase n=1 Tax=Modestobacter versicolor TaxID=429133 RepID=A0A323VFA0_9ACTN|nr:SDR family NAD(P)-dependent oxidoreductase [Modestobacter versicolor]MBB3676904.1 NAD(P)-dependent dehydrogenase (short-subunit alcohol dehydrogenase family) [Modestobacter versicolor]PZA21946.1 3-oxoacyl-ACP reductase [Modestobacter versicolor]
MTSTDLTGRRVLLTGASRGVGRAVARRLVAAGADVLGTARDEQLLDELARELTGGPGTFVPVVADLTDPATPARLAGVVDQRWGALDVLFSNAGVMLARDERFEDEPAGTLEETLAVNLVAPHRLVIALLPALRGGKEPRVVHVGSGAGTIDGIAEPGIASYRVSKFALNGLVLVQAAQLHGEIAVNAFDPGWVRTGLGGDEAPGTVEESADGAMALLGEPASVTGRFFKDGAEIPF